MKTTATIVGANLCVSRPFKSNRQGDQRSERGGMSLMSLVCIVYAFVFLLPTS
jgi:hypothetical protein